MNHKVKFVLLTTAFPYNVWANPNMLGGLEVLFWGGILFLGLTIVAAFLLFKAGNRKSGNGAFILMILPSLLIGLLLVVGAVKIAGHGVMYPGSLRDMFLTMFIPGIILVVSAFVVFFRKKIAQSEYNKTRQTESLKCA